MTPAHVRCRFSRLCFCCFWTTSKAVAAGDVGEEALALARWMRVRVCREESKVEDRAERRLSSDWTGATWLAWWANEGSATVSTLLAEVGYLIVDLRVRDERVGHGDYKTA